MRKVICTLSFDTEKFEPYQIIKVRDENGVITELLREEIPIEKYTLAELRKIDQCNAALRNHSMTEMTEEEIEFMLHPTGGTKSEDEKVTEDELQRLAGFKVEKTVTYYDDLHNK